MDKANKAGLDITSRVASIDELPYPDGYFDLVTSSMMFHHLPVETKEKGLREIRRVLQAQGRFFLCDFLTPHPLTAPLMFLLLVWVLLALVTALLDSRIKTRESERTWLNFSETLFFLSRSIKKGLACKPRM